jgi:hypothetical protein
MNTISKGIVAGALGVVLTLATGMPMAGALQDRDQIAPTRPAHEQVATASVLSRSHMPICAWRHC